MQTTINNIVVTSENKSGSTHIRSKLINLVNHRVVFEV